ncbi:hypothetical protein CDV31_006758 [Fusarium ambrosium]|uniref:Uncharacterized protein n=1 Tax=Fusarium ambrosium TaxID=131363 RepID=A0A428UB61_9HYPO|nr:hypothetical protein CDV31_006758 [Fusarium ambrosium]
MSMGQRGPCQQQQQQQQQYATPYAIPELPAFCVCGIGELPNAHVIPFNPLFPNHDAKKLL